MFNLNFSSMPKKLNSMPNYQARMPRQPHSLNRSHGFSTAPGMLRSPYWFPLHTGDNIHFQPSLFVRFNPLIVPFVGEVEVHCDYFFVPLSVMYTPAPSLFYQTDDLISSSFDRSNLIKDRFPLYDVNGSLNSILTATSSDHGNGPNSDASDLAGDFFTNKVFDCRGKAAVRMCDDFKLSPLPLFSSGDQPAYTPNFNYTPWDLLAYHAVYQLYDGYRNTDRQSKNYLYNVDNYCYSSSAWTDYRLLQLNYIDADKDYFNSVKVSPISSSVSMLGDSSSVFKSVNNYLGLDSSFQLAADDQTPQSNFTGATQVSFSGNNGNYFISSATLRSMFAFEKLLRVIGRADKNYESQFLAHFGVKIPHDVMHNITHIGHDMCELKSEPVVSTANTFNSSTGQGSALGEIGGQGFVSATFRKRDFQAPTHGIFITMFYIKPRMRYQTVFSKLHDWSSPMKWWQPEYDHLGMQPLFQYEANTFSNASGNNRLGWQFGYEHFKRLHDDVSYAFFTPLGGQSSTVNQYNPWFLSKLPFCSVGVDNNSVVHFGTSTFHGFKCMPTDLNNVMQVPYSPTWLEDLDIEKLHTLFYTDPFICDFKMTNVDVNFMSEYSEPEL